MFESSFCKVSYLEKQNAILCEWKKFCKNQDYQNPLEYGLELLNQYSATTWITDTTNGFENDEADSKWLIEEFIPKTIDSTCKNIIFIMRDDSPLKEEILFQKEALSKFFNVEIAENLIQKDIIL